jgi:hypothetical protein
VLRREDFFFPFILGTYDDPPPSVESFCTRYVEPMAEESDNIHIVALTDALEVGRQMHKQTNGQHAAVLFHFAAYVCMLVHILMPFALHCTYEKHLLCQGSHLLCSLLCCTHTRYL